jgi:hypothetical protein
VGVVRVPLPYDLRRTLECGQVFRWTVTDGGAIGVVRGRVWHVRQEDGLLQARGDARLVAQQELMDQLVGFQAQVFRVRFGLLRLAGLLSALVHHLVKVRGTDKEVTPMVYKCLSHRFYALLPGPGHQGRLVNDAQI